MPAPFGPFNVMQPVDQKKKKVMWSANYIYGYYLGHNVLSMESDVISVKYRNWSNLLFLEGEIEAILYNLKKLKLIQNI